MTANGMSFWRNLHMSSFVNVIDNLLAFLYDDFTSRQAVVRI